MKAIKLASIFAVTAVAAAVSTTTIAAEPVFSGTAGLEYQSNDGASDASASNGEVNIIGDTGVVYFDMDMDTSTGHFLLDEAYVTQGAVQFGDFDGSLGDAAAFSAGVEEDLDDAKETLGADLAVRYSVSDELTVAVESAEGSNKASLGFSYLTNVSGMGLGVSGGFHDGDNVTVALGVSAPLASATLSAFVIAGSLAEADVMDYGVGLDLPLSEELSFAAQYYTRTGESSVGTDYADEGITEATVNYQVGDIRYYASLVSYEASTLNNYTVVGAEASF